MNYPDPSSGHQSYPQGPPDGAQSFNPASGQFGHSAPQWSGQQGQLAGRPASKLDLIRVLMIAVAALGLLAWLLGLFGGLSPLSYLSIAAAGLALIALLPSTEQRPLPNLVPYVAVMAIIGGLTSTENAVHSSSSLDDALDIVVLVLAVLELFVAVAAVLLSQGLLKAPQPKPYMPQQPPWAGNQHYGQQPYPGPYGPAHTGSAPGQQSPAGGQAPTSGPQQGHFDPSQFPAARPQDSGTAQFPPSGGFGQ